MTGPLVPSPLAYARSAVGSGINTETFLSRKWLFLPRVIQIYIYMNTTNNILKDVLMNYMVYFMMAAVQILHVLDQNLHAIQT